MKMLPFRRIRSLPVHIIILTRIRVLHGVMMGGMVCSIMIILHLDRTVIGVLWICRHAMVCNMGPVVKMRGRLHLDRLHEETKKKARY